MHVAGRWRTRRALLALAAVSALVVGIGPGIAAGASPTRVLVPIGSDYQQPTLQLFARAAAGADASGHVLILVLPTTYSRDAYRSSNGERQQNLTLATARAGLVQDACVAVKAPAQTCETLVVPVLTRPDAFLASNVAYFTPDVDGIYILGGDQTISMLVTAATPLEQAMAAAYARGAAVGGNSAGDAVQSLTMINGFTGSNGPAESLRQGTVDLWSYSGPGDGTRGLIFGLPNAVDEQHIYERGRFGRAVNVAFTTGLPVVGMDAATGATIVDERTLANVVGFTSGAVVDPTTWGAAGSFAGPTFTLSVRRVAVHLLPPGGYGYDLDALQPVVGGALQPAPSIAGRTFPAFTTPSGAGPLLVAGGIVRSAPGAVTSRFVSLAGGAGARLVVLAAGYAKSNDANKDAKALAAALQPGVGAPVAWFVLDGKTDQAAVAAAIADATGVLLTAPDRSAVMGALGAQASVLAAVRSAWLGGSTLLADDAAAAALGGWFVAEAPPGADIDTESSEAFLESGVTVAAGLGWIGGATVEPRLLPDRNWGQLWHLVSRAPGSLAVGVDVGTALEVSGGTATVRGDSAAVVLDGRSATFGTGSNGAMAATWVVLDTFVGGETLAP